MGILSRLKTWVKAEYRCSCPICKKDIILSKEPAGKIFINCYAATGGSWAKISLIHLDCLKKSD